MIVSTYSLIVSFVVISLVALAFYFKYIKKERSGAAPTDDGDNEFNKLATNYSAPLT